LPAKQSGYAVREKQLKNYMNLQGARLSFLPRWLHLLVLAALFTGLNAVKPLHIDDAAYYCFAKQIVTHPLDPYGFELLWYQRPEPANQVLAPPVLPYWWAGAIAIFGDQPVLWKLSLFPFAATFVFALSALFRRFAPGWERPLTWMTVLSPTFLPSMNMMLDVPALALALGSLVLFLKACDQRSLAGALAAGLVAGLAVQTKYTAAIGVILLVLYSFLRRQWRLGLAAGAIAGMVFLSWEGFTALHYSKPHFLANFGQKRTVSLGVADQALSLLTILGGVFSAGALLNLTALRASPRIVVAAAVVILLGYAAIAWVPAETVSPPALNDAVFACFGLLALGTTFGVGRQLLRAPVAKRKAAAHEETLDSVFLLLWLALELAGYFGMSPFPAVRRVMGLVIGATLLAGRLASRAGPTSVPRVLVNAVAAFGILLGIAFYGIDLSDAFTLKEGAEEAAARIHEKDPQATIWFAGHWGFQFYGERAGMHPIAPGGPNDLPSPSVLRQGDWIVMPDHRVHHQQLGLDSRDCGASGIPPVVIEGYLPVRTVESFYVGTTPLQHTEGPRLKVGIYRVMRDFAARPPA
jgi:hypothetical protein